MISSRATTREIKVKTMKIEIKIDNDKASLYTPYNQEFVKRVKNIDSAKWDKSNKCWVIPADAVDAAREIMVSVYGEDDRGADETVKLRVKVLEGLYGLRSDVNLLGKCLCHAYSRDSGGKAGTDVSYVVGQPDSSGSAKNWYSAVPPGSEIILSNVSKVLWDAYEPTDDIVIVAISSGGNKDKLVAERAALVARIQEIDRLLAE